MICIPLTLAIFGYQHKISLATILNIFMNLRNIEVFKLFFFIRFYKKAINKTL